MNQEQWSILSSQWGIIAAIVGIAIGAITLIIAAVKKENSKNNTANVKSVSNSNVSINQHNQ